MVPEIFVTHSNGSAKSKSIMSTASVNICPRLAYSTQSFVSFCLFHKK